MRVFSNLSYYNLYQLIREQFTREAKAKECLFKRLRRPPIWKLSQLRFLFPMQMPQKLKKSLTPKVHPSDPRLLSRHRLFEKIINQKQRNNLL